MQYAFIYETMCREKFAEKYPDANPVSFGESFTNEQDGDITLAEYFFIDNEEVFLSVDELGQIQKTKKKPENATQVRKTTRAIIRRYKMTGNEILEESVFPGEYIPIIPVYGEENWIDGERRLLSLIRRSKDSQRMCNFWASLETEILMSSPKAKFVAVEGTVEDYAEEWANPNKSAVLRHKSTDLEGRPASPPIPIPPTQIPMGVVNARQSTVNDIRASMGLYDSFLGQQDNAISGVAIQGRQREGDRAVFHFADNLNRAIKQVGRILVSAIPVIYDTPRIVQIIGKEDTNDRVGINGAFVEGQERIYDLTQGKYTVSVSSGASYATMRQEATEFFERIIQSQPHLMQIAGDLLFKYADFPGAKALSERLKKTIDPNILNEELEPQAMALQMQNQQLEQNIQILQGQISDLQEKLDNKQAELEIKAQAEKFDDEADKRKHQIEVAKLQLEEQKITGELQMKSRELEMKAYELGMEVNQKLNERVSQLSEDVNYIGD